MTKRILRHRPEWKLQFSEEAALICRAFEGVCAIHHIGSTAIPRIFAKPTVDILVEVSCLSVADQRTSDMEKIGYVAKGEYGVAQRRYFTKADRTGASAVHVHVFRAGSLDAKAHIAFRNYLRRFPEKAAAYSRIKQSLADEHGRLGDDYQSRKAQFVEIMRAEALDWVNQFPAALD
ncbi:GrpB family protein [Hyphococcus sp.]|uniref:GrpB family protein n=1 Tax=Hyphococcus sp. TaxID=2038636 RepID=UPI002082E61B|nr:MAG: hypothetical protein DHS20C04_18480 [Marinicaulis sp.]